MIKIVPVINYEPSHEYKWETASSSLNFSARWSVQLHAPCAFLPGKVFGWEAKLATAAVSTVWVREKSHALAGNPSKLLGRPARNPRYPVRRQGNPLHTCRHAVPTYKYRTNAKRPRTVPGEEKGCIVVVRATVIQEVDGTLPLAELAKHLGRRNTVIICIPPPAVSRHKLHVL